jgi:hypothetical protein
MWSFPFYRHDEYTLFVSNHLVISPQPLECLFKISLPSDVIDT